MLENDLTHKILIALVSYVLGFSSCYMLKKQVGSRTDIESKFPIKENTFVLAVVTVIWALSVLVDIVSPQYETSPFVHGLMGAIVGFFYKPGSDNKS
jgi:uncharacterized membrane protein